MKPEFDPSNLLMSLASSQSTGCLEVSDGQTTWSVFLQFGALLRIECSVQSLGQLLSRLRQQGCDVAARAVMSTIEKSGDLSEKQLVREEIDRLTKQGLIDQSQANQISVEFTREALETLLWSTQGYFILR